MDKMQKEVKSSRLRKLKRRFEVIERSENYLKEELSKIREKKAQLKEKIRKEKKAISLTNRARMLRINQRK